MNDGESKNNISAGGSQSQPGHGGNNFVLPTTAAAPQQGANLTRRFGGVARLYGETGAERLRNAHVAVVGIGGVGSWTVEALARSGVGALTLFDLDMVAESNTNRQIHALGDVYGRAKVAVMAERVRAINPVCRVNVVEDFVSPDNVDTFLAADFSALIDACDDLRAKVAMVVYAQTRALPLVVVGAAGGQIDPTRVRLADLSDSVQDPLLARLRTELRRHHGFARGGKKMGVRVVYSDEALRYPTACEHAGSAAAPQGLNCAGFGSSVCVTAAFGLAAAAEVINRLSQAARHGG